MSISVKNRKILWGLSGNRCAFPGCNQQLHQTVGECGNSLIGEECHIEAQNINGPRFNSELSEKQIDDYHNLILLCPTHHKIIDDNPQEYSVEHLKKMKSDHENHVRRILDDKAGNDDMQYEAIMLYIDMMLDFQYWEAWTSYLMSAQPLIVNKDLISNIEEIQRYIISRIWPQRYPELENAFNNFNVTLHDLYDVFMRHAESDGIGYRTIKFYRTNPYDYRLADKLLPSYNRHVYVVNNLVIEVTKAGNHLCDMIRKYVDSSYRIVEGKLMVDNECPEYKDVKKYPGLIELEQNAMIEFPETL